MPPAPPSCDEVTLDAEPDNNEDFDGYVPPVPERIVSLAVIA